MLVNRIANTQQSQQSKRPIEKPLRVEFLAIAGGGGGTRSDGAGGGGAGGVITGSFCAQKFIEYPLFVGSGSGHGGDYAFPGQNTSAFDVVALGGGGGQANNGPLLYLNGGSGGGAGTIGAFGIGLQPTASYTGFGNNAAAGGGVYAPTGGGGAGSSSNGKNGGDGVLLTFYTSSAKYGPGGAATPLGGDMGAAGQGDSYGRGGNGNSAETLPPGLDGNKGVVIIKYSGAPKATGGVIRLHGNTTYHFFEDTGSFTFKVTTNDDNFAQNNCNDGVSV